MSFTFTDESKTVIKTIDAQSSTVTIPSTVTEIQSFSLNSNSFVKQIFFEDNSQLVTMSINAFRDSNIELISLANCNRLESISKWCFRNCQKLSSIALPEHGILNRLCEGAFMLNAFKIFIVPRSVEWIEDCSGDACAVFHGCKKMERCVFGAGSKCYHIGKTVFFECFALTELIIPPLVKLLSDNIFYNCHALKSVWLLSNKIEISANAFDTIKDSIGPIYVMSSKIKNSIIRKCALPRKAVIVVSSCITPKRKTCFSMIRSM